jgi:hypothetical protein
MKIFGLLSSSLSLLSGGVLGDIRVTLEDDAKYEMVAHQATFEIKAHVQYDPLATDDAVITVDGSIQGGEDHKFFKLQPGKEAIQYNLK